jgi:hypothetical protein
MHNAHPSRIVPKDKEQSIENLNSRTVWIV